MCGTSVKSALGVRRTSVGTSKAGRGMGVGTGDYPIFVDNLERGRGIPGRRMGGVGRVVMGTGGIVWRFCFQTRAGSVTAVAVAGPVHAVPSITGLCQIRGRWGY